jgi:hypothetical protein
LFPFINQRQLMVVSRSQFRSLHSTCWMCLFLCLEMGIRTSLSSELLSALQSPQ